MTGSVVRQIGEIGNYYGSLCVKAESGRCYWSIENYDGDHWEEIPQYLFDALNRFQDDDTLSNTMESGE